MQNPTQQPLALNPGELKLTAVTPDSTSSEKFDVIALVTVPAKEPIHKLIVQREDGTAVIRYDLTGKIAALPAWAGAGAELNKGEKQNIRVFFRVPRDANPKTITITDRETGRSIAFPTSQDWFEIRDCVRSLR